MENKREKFIHELASSFFYIGVIIEVLIVIIDKSNYINPLEGQLFRLTFLLFLVKVCLTKCTKKEYLAIGLFCILGFAIYFMSGRNEALRLVIFVVACKDIDMHKCLKLVFYITLAGCIAIILMSVMRIYGGISLTEDFGRGYVETRYTLGMGHPNALQCMVWALTTLGIYLYGNQMKWYHYMGVFLINVGFFLLTDSKTSLLVTLYTIILAFFMCDRHSDLVKKISAWIGGLTTVFSIGISVIIACNAYRVYNYVWHMDRSPMTRFFTWMNGIMNGRIRILTENKRFEGSVSTWRIFSGPENSYYFDMGWIRLFYWYGILPACVFIAVLLLVVIYCYRQRQYLAIMLLSSFALYSVIEAHAISVYLARNYTFFLIGMVWSPLLLNKGEFTIENKKNKY